MLVLQDYFENLTVSFEETALNAKGIFALIQLVSSNLDLNIRANLF